MTTGRINQVTHIQDVYNTTQTCCNTYSSLNCIQWAIQFLTKPCCDQFLPLPVVKLSNSINDHIAFSHTNFVSNIFKQLPLPQTHSCFNYTKGILVAEIYFTLIDINTHQSFQAVKKPISNLFYVENTPLI